MFENKEPHEISITSSTEDNFNRGHVSASMDVLTDVYLDRLQRTAYALSGLPDGDEYVHVIGRGNEGSNLESIGTLIEKLIDILSEIPTNQHLEKVMEELSSRFHDLRYLVIHH